MADLTIVAHIQATADGVALVKSELLKLIEPTRAESGCVQYDLHEDNDDPTKFLFFENWESRDQWQAHMANDHLKAFVSATEGALASLMVQEMTRIG